MMPASVVGQSEVHLCDASDAAWLTVPIHREVVDPFRALKESAASSGFDVAVLSGFRSFDRQLSIWNRKARGQLAVLDSHARPLDITTLSERELAYAILRWSALPGASRHHWGTDIDVYDAAARPEGYEIELVPSEYEGEGMFAPFSAWLDERLTPPITNPTPAQLEAIQRVYKAGRRPVEALMHGGAKFVTGTDIPVAPLVPGFSVHHELAALVEAGLTPMQAIQAGTRNSAQASGRGAQVGTIEAGKRADLVLLDADPSKDISNTRRIRAVVTNGRLLDRATLDSLLSEAERFARADTVRRES